MASRDELRAIAREIKDFDLYDASYDISQGWEYLRNIGERFPDIAKQQANFYRNVQSTVTANYRRYKKLLELVHDVNEEYREIYESELRLLNNYLYKAISDIVEEAYPDAWDNMLVRNEKSLAEKAKKRAEYEQNHAKEIAEKRAERARARLEKAKARVAELEQETAKLEADIPAE